MLSEVLGTLRTLQVTGNTRLKVSLKFLLSLCILRYWNTFENLVWKTPGMLSWALLAQDRALGWDNSAVTPSSVPEPPWQPRACLCLGPWKNRVGTRGSAARASPAWARSGGLLCFEVSPTGMVGAVSLPAAANPCTHPPCVTCLSPSGKCLFQHSVSRGLNVSRVLCLTVPAFCRAFGLPDAASN